MRSNTQGLDQRSWVFQDYSATKQVADNNDDAACGIIIAFQKKSGQKRYCNKVFWNVNLEDNNNRLQH
jgi:hypothetical protein